MTVFHPAWLTTLGPDVVERLLSKQCKTRFTAHDVLGQPSLSDPTSPYHNMTII
jgi:hypothetical protein